MSQIRFFFGDTFGTYYLVIGLGIFILSLYIACSKYGDRLVYYVYEEDDEYAIQDVELRPQIIYSDIEPEVSNDVEFDRIQDVLIQGIRDAKYLIWVAVAWFSNEVLYQELLKKKQNGIHIRIIISDEDSNQNLLQGSAICAASSPRFVI